MLCVKLIIVLLCCFSGIYGSDDNNLQKPVERYSPLVNYVMNKLSLSSSLQKYARKQRSLLPQVVDNSIHADLFRNAQDEIGIHEKNVLPVVDVFVNTDIKNVVAYVTENKINVVCPNFFFLPYGAQRVTALHEAYHNKYNDKLFMKWAEQKMTVATVVSSGVTSGVMAMVSTWSLMRLHPIPNNILRITSYIAPPIVCGLSNAAAANMLLTNFSKYYYTFLEYRADRDAVISADCYCCVQQYKDVTGNGRPDKYLQSCEIAAYAEQFKKENRVCQVHAGYKSDSTR